MATKALPRFIRVNGHVYKLAAEPSISEEVENIHKRKQVRDVGKKVEEIKQKSQEEKQQQAEGVEQQLAAMKIKLANGLVKGFAMELNNWVKTFNMPPPTKGDPNNALHAFVAFKDAFLEKNKEITDKALAKAAEILQVPVTASTKRR